MTSTFPHADKGELGYDVDEVERFLERARLAYTDDAGEPLTADEIRSTAFALHRDGYVTAHVDAALERLEDAFAAREREQRIRSDGDAAWYGRARETAQTLLDRFVRPPAHRFQRVSWFTIGYSTRDVDELVDRVAAYFQTGAAVTVEDVRTSVFSAQRGGYSEAQVDAVLDAVVDTLLAVR